jgi:hypothetical protein
MGLCEHWKDVERTYRGGWRPHKTAHRREHDCRCLSQRHIESSLVDIADTGRNRHSGLDQSGLAQ